MTAHRTHPLRNALQLDPICGIYIEMATTFRDGGRRHVMRCLALEAIRQARLVWRTYVDLPPAA